MLNMDHARTLLYLLFTSDGPCSGVDLARAVGVSAKTLRKDIASVNALLKPKGMSIEARTAVGYVILYEDEQEYLSLKKAVIHQYANGLFYPSPQRFRVNYIIRALLAAPSVSLDELAEGMHYSSAVVRADVVEMRAELDQKFNLRLSSKGGRLSLSGDEWNLRMCFVWELSVYRKNSLLSETREELFETLSTGGRPSLSEVVGAATEAMGERFLIGLDHLENLAAWVLISYQRAGSAAGLTYSMAELEEAEALGTMAAARSLYRALHERYGAPRAAQQDIIGLALLMGLCIEHRVEYGRDVALFDEHAIMRHIGAYYPFLAGRAAAPAVHEFCINLEHEIERVQRQRRYLIYTDQDYARHVQRRALRLTAFCTCVLSFLLEEGIIAEADDYVAAVHIVSLTFYLRTVELWSPQVRGLVVGAASASRRALLSSFVERNAPVRVGQVRDIAYSELPTVDAGKFDFIFTDEDSRLSLSTLALPRMEGNLPVVSVACDISTLGASFKVGDEPFETFLLRSLFPPRAFFKTEIIASAEDVFRYIRGEVAEQLSLPEHFCEALEAQGGMVNPEKPGGIALLMPYSNLSDDFLAVVCCKKTFIWHAYECRTVVLCHLGARANIFSGVLDAAIARLVSHAALQHMPWEDVTYEAMLRLMSA